MPVVVVTGARQTGKSTLVRKLVEDGRPYYTLDSLDVLEQASTDPDDLVARAEKMALDEVQRAPELLFAVKRAVDEGRTRGRYLLTGSANLLLMSGVSESLAGRASYLTLWPLTRRESLGLGRAGVWSELFDTPVDEWPEIFERHPSPEADYRELAWRGGYPVPALELEDAEERAIWFDGYIRTYLERDLQELSSITSLVDFRRLMRAVVFRTGQVANQTEIGRDLQLTQPTVHRWLNLLETSYQLVRLPAYAVNRTKRLIKSPKLYWCDTGLALHIGQSEPEGAHLENLLLSDLLAWRDAHLVNAPGLYYWRTTTGREVDFVIERDGALVGVEVKASKKVRSSDARHLRAFADEYGDTLKGAVVAYDGSRVEWLAPGVLAVPWWGLI